MTSIDSNTGDQITAEVLTVTPEMALEWLTDPKFEGPNRRVRRARIKQYAADMRSGRWKMTGEAIKFDYEGKLRDGQHRLMAICQAETPVPLMVIRGVAPEAQDVMDTGTARVAGDVLAIHGLANGNILAAAARILVSYKKGELTTFQRSTRAANDEILQFVENNPMLGELFSDFAATLRKIPMNASMTLTTFFLIAEHDREGAIEFFTKLAAGSNLREGDPILTLRERLMLIRGERQKHSIHTMMSLVLRTYNSWASGQQLLRVMMYGKGNDPMLIPTIITTRGD